ncbi:MAG TPA: YggS family pyridoxal phosphate-dependent enzyme [Verrucomicrobia bacterium]|nr:MAG: YggS family pyridoxal phosphate enzyme [Lentisphaerae bacterium GWF2_57_35]HBA82491.1 YggS family pyridoxal phosphate-dependent enzyme [Verrucomicrobiota bacterium]
MANDTFQERLEAVQARVKQACARCGRSPAEVRLVAVSKTMGPEQIREAAACGLTLFGENKVQEAYAKIPECPGCLAWHMIGHLQRNKVAVAVELFDMIHSVDSLRLLEAVDRAAGEAGKTMPVLLEVNVSGERSKFGLTPDAAPELLAAANLLSHIQLAGLMTMPPFAEEPEKARPYFRRLRELRDQWNAEHRLALSELSMGMTHDFEVAIEEGSTMIRVGTALFGSRPKPAVQQEME